MNKITILLLLAILGAAGAILFYPPWREAARPYLPAVVQNFLPAPGQTGDDKSTAKDGTRKAGGDSSAGGSSDKGGRGSGPIAVTVASAEQFTLPLVERTYGIVQSPAVVAINARTTSQVIEIHVRDGQQVKAGDLLLSLDDRPLQAQLAKDMATLAKDRALAVSAAADMQRAFDLMKKQAGTPQAYDQALAAQKAADAVIGADQATVGADTVQLEFTKIKAPFSGRLGAVQVAVGALVGGSGTTGNLMTITQMAPLKVTFRLPERNLGDIRAALDAGRHVPVRALQSGTVNILDTGGLDFIDSAVDTTSGTIAMSATIGNAELRLWPGQYVDLEVEHGALAAATVVPTVAIQAGQAGSFVWLVKDDNTVETQPVVVARSEAGKSAISTGLAPGDRVVIEGQLRLKNGAQVMVVGAKTDDATEILAGTPAAGNSAKDPVADKPKKKP